MCFGRGGIKHLWWQKTSIGGNEKQGWDFRITFEGGRAYTFLPCMAAFEKRFHDAK